MLLYIDSKLYYLIISKKLTPNFTLILFYLKLFPGQY